MIGAGATTDARGCMRVVHGASMLSRAAGRLLRLPAANAAADVRVTITRVGAVRVWTRTFDGVALISEQRDTGPGVIVETFGRLECRFRVEPEDGATRYRQTGAALRLGSVRLPLPRILAPHVDGLERQTERDAFHVQVRVTWPPAGLILEYDGHVRIENRPA